MSCRFWDKSGTLLYLISPLDISPDVLPILGQVDDVAILFLLMSELWQMVREGLAPSEEIASDVNSTVNAPNDEDTVDVEAVSVD
ncbi:YkvA family protein [Sodalinema gerasimenkoae]|uniref:YkvA family protein n=1 Tax=Sodalinema gerasimenkoae TaxID=2862348 RepID=UPI0031B597F1